MVATQIQIDASGKLLSFKVLRVHPRGAPFGMEVEKNIDKVIFSPGYLNGRPIACSTTWIVPFWHPDRGKKWLQ